MQTSILVRLGVMVAILFGLLIPLMLTSSLVAERGARRDEAVTAIGSTWGGAQVLAGPVLSIPYECPPIVVDTKGTTQPCLARAFFLPESLEITGVIDPEVRRRSLFEAVVYRAQLKVTSRFKPNFAGISPAAVAIRWSEATLDVGLTEAKGVARKVQLTSGGQPSEFQPSTLDVGLFASGMQAGAGLTKADDVANRAFSFDMQVNGTRDLRFLCAAKEAAITVSSSWRHPGFVGARLPESHEATAAGFKARWTAGAFGSPFPSRWTADVPVAQLRKQAESSDFGVSLIQPVDIYHQTDRAVKYAVLFIVLTFVVTFLWEVTRKVRVHPVQYLFVGFAMCVFYLLLLSLSEHAGFDRAYAVATGATVVLLGWYWKWVVGGVLRGATMAGILSAMYGFLYLLLRLEDYALLAGSLGVFLILATVMFMTRRIDWFALQSGATTKTME